MKSISSDSQATPPEFKVLPMGHKALGVPMEGQVAPSKWNFQESMFFSPYFPLCFVSFIIFTYILSFI
jgi:hypothetical protein